MLMTYGPGVSAISDCKALLTRMASPGRLVVTPLMLLSGRDIVSKEPAIAVPRCAVAVTRIVPAVSDQIYSLCSRRIDFHYLPSRDLWQPSFDLIASGRQHEMWGGSFLLEGSQPVRVRL